MISIVTWQINAEDFDHLVTDELLATSRKQSNVASCLSRLGRLVDYETISQYGVIGHAVLELPSRNGDGRGHHTHSLLFSYRTSVVKSQ